MAEIKSVPDSLESYDEDEVDDMISDANRLIASVYSTLFNSSVSSSDGGGTSDSRNTSPQTPPARMNETPSSLEVRLEIDRINRLCEAADRNIRATESDLRALPMIIPSSMNECDGPLNESIRNEPGAQNSPIRSPRRRNRVANPSSDDVIDLSDTLHTALIPSRNYGTVGGDADDDVIIVSSNLSNVVDLCTPTRDTMGVRRERNNPPLSIRQRLTTARHFNNTNSDSNRSLSRYTTGSGSSSTRSRSPRIQAARTRRTLTCAVQTSTTNIRDNTQPQQHKNANLSSSESSSASSLNAIASSDSSESTSNNGRTPFMCAVCMESCLNNMPTSTKCGHVFCANCINQAIRLTHKCPMCNTKLNSRMLFRIYI